MITINYFVPNTGKQTTHDFMENDVSLATITDMADKLDYSVFNAYEGHALIGYGTKFANGWNYHSYS